MGSRTTDGDKEAGHFSTRPGVELSKAEALEFITRPIWYGWPEVPDHPGRGPKPSKDQYRRALERRRDLYRRLVKNTQARRGELIYQDLVAEALRRIPPGTPAHRLVGMVMDEILELKGISLPRSTVCRALRRIRSR